MFERLAFETARMPNIDYLINTYESAEQRKRRIKKDKTTALQLVNALQALAVSYTGLVLSDPTLFSETPVFTREQYMEQFMSKLCADQLPRTFFADLVARYEKDNPEAVRIDDRHEHAAFMLAHARLVRSRSLCPCSSRSVPTCSREPLCRAFYLTFAYVSSE